MRYRVTTPVAGYEGSVGAVQFTNGTADVDSEAHASELAYFKARGYDVEELADEEPAAEDAALEMPRKSASTEAWRAYAVASRQLSEDEAAVMSRDELVEYFTSEEEQA